MRRSTGDREIAVIDDRNRPLHPLHAILLAFPIALFTAALVSDIAYLNTAEMQWSNLSAWAIAGALLLGAPVVLLAAIGTVRHRRSRAVPYLILVASMWVLGLLNAFQHSHDAWSSVGAVGLLLSVASSILAVAAGWVGFSYGRGRETAR